MGNNIRNKSCPCGSGKKYKKCHGSPDFKPLNIYEIDNYFRINYTRKICMAPEKLKKNCSRRIIKAHTISKSNNLKKIAKDSHVYGFKKSILFLDKNNGIFPIEKIGINKASVLNNFCSKHDKELFSVIEDNEMLFSNEQIFKLAYRSICNELYLKRASVNNQKNINEKIPLYILFSIKEIIDSIIEGSEVAIRDLEYLKQYYDKNIIEQSFDTIKYYIMIIDKIPEIFNNAAWIPTVDFNNNFLANLENKNRIFNTLTVNTIQFNGKGAIVFAWHNIIECQDCIKFIKSLHKIENEYKSLAILKWLFECNENIYFSIDWWDKLEQNIKDELIKSYMNMTKLKQNISNYKNLYGAINWKIIDIKTNIEQLNE